nr:MAG TPA: hypothetical protein [Inoviridae sp.]
MHILFIQLRIVNLNLKLFLCNTLILNKFYNNNNSHLDKVTEINSQL